MMRRQRGGAGRQGVALFDTFYRSGALVFGGGHVALHCSKLRLSPRLGDERSISSGLRVAQAVPGPLHIRRSPVRQRSFRALLAPASAT